MKKKIRKAAELYRSQGLAGVAKGLVRRLTGRAAPQPRVWSEYLSWLTFANAGMLTRGNVWCIDHAIRNLPGAAPIIEIGSFCGLSTNIIGYLKEKHGVKNPLITCDKWLFEGAESGGMLGDSPSVSHADYRQFVKDTYMRNVRTFSRNDLPYTVEMFSDEFFGNWASGQKLQDVFGREVSLGGPIGFCYIDGNHSYEFAKRDFENCDRFLAKGGFVLFDDSADGSKWEVCRVVQEVLQSGRYDLVANNPNYFFRKK